MAVPDIREMIDTDHEYIDLTVNVQVQQVNGTFFEVSHALRFNLGMELGSVGDAMLPGGTVMFALWIDQCPERPKISGTLTDLDAGEEFKIFEVKDVAARSRYDVYCVPKVVKTVGP